MLKSLIFSNFFLKKLKVTFHLQILQNIGCILPFGQNIFVACLIPSIFYLPLSYPFIALPRQNRLFLFFKKSVRKR